MEANGHSDLFSQSLERVWEIVSNVFGSQSRGFERSITNLFGSSNARYVKRFAPKVNAINSLEPRMPGADRRGITRVYR